MNTIEWKSEFRWEDEIRSKYNRKYKFNIQSIIRTGSWNYKIEIQSNQLWNLKIYLKKVNQLKEVKKQMGRWGCQSSGWLMAGNA